MRTATLAAATLLLSLAGTAAAQDAPAPPWLTDFEMAKRAAKQDAKVVLAAFVGSDWCGYSIRQQQEVFDKPAFADWARKNAVLLLVDFPNAKELPAEQREHNRELARLCGVRGYPTMVVLDATGKQLGSLRYAPGGVRHWIERADEVLALGKPQPPTARGDWTSDYDAALQKARQEQKRLLVNFTGSDWCPYCIRLKEEIFSKPEFVAWAKQHVVLVELDFPRRKKLPEALVEQNKKLQEQFGIEGFPTVVFVGADGKEVSRLGYEGGGPTPWIAAAERELGLKPKDDKAPVGR